jgi:protein subunit release factor B
MVGRMIARAGVKRGWQVEELDEEGLLLRLVGQGCEAALSERGLHRFVTSSGKGGKRHTSFCKVEAWSAPRGTPALRESDVEFKAQKAGGPGGQHVNKTESAMRATHKPSGLSVFCSAERSQFENKRLALEWLGAKLARSAEAAEASRRQDAWRGSARSGAGEAIRSYWLDEDRVQDAASGAKAKASWALDGHCESWWAPAA